MIQTLFCTTSRTTCSCSLFLQLLFISERKETKSSHDEQFVLEIKVFATWYRRICLIFRERIVSPEIINSILGDKNTLHGYSQSNLHLIHQADIHQSYLTYFRVFNMLKILLNKNRVIYWNFHRRMLHLVFPYSNQY